MSDETPILIVGAGPAGIAASMQARRDLVRHLIVGTEPPGGLLPAAWRIDNLPGHPGGVRGDVLASLMREQVDALELPLVRDTVEIVEWTGRMFDARLESGLLIHARNMVLCTGTRPRPWDPPGAHEARQEGRVHRDARTLPEDLTDRCVGIVGSGDAAFDTGLTVHRRGGRAVILARGSVLRANRRILDRVERARMDVKLRAPVSHLALGRDDVLIGETGVRAHHVVVCIGREPDLRLYRHIVPEGPPPRDIITPVEGLFVAGDMIAGRDRFIASAYGQGQRAAILAEALLDS